MDMTDKVPDALTRAEREQTKANVGPPSNQNDELSTTATAKSADDVLKLNKNTILEEIRRKSPKATGSGVEGGDIINEQEQEVDNRITKLHSAETSTIGDDSHLPTTPSHTPPQLASSLASSIAATPPVAILDNILSPPKSETQTDETNTATSSSPASESQLSPLPSGEASAVLMLVKSPKVTAAPINVVANGTMPKSGKPFMLSMSKKPISKPTRATRLRRPKGSVAMYESEISENKIGIKLCIKKSDALVTGTVATTTTVVAVTATAAATPVVASNRTATTSTTTTMGGRTAAGAANRKRARKSKTRPLLDNDDSEFEARRKKERGGGNNNNTERQKKVSFSGVPNEEPKKPVEQSDWGARLPEEILHQIFQKVIEHDGCLPTLVRLGRVCSLWRCVSLSPTLWRNMNLSKWIKEKYRTELKLKWFVDNRCSSCTELNVADWKVSDINCFLAKLAAGCPNLEGITLAGWKNFTVDHLAYLVENQKKLKRLDLSSVNTRELCVAYWNHWCTAPTSTSVHDFFKFHMVFQIMCTDAGIVAVHVLDQFCLPWLRELSREGSDKVVVEMNASKSAVGVQSLCSALQTVGGRLTHLYLAHNRLAGIPQIVNVLATYCSNLQLLDLSNVTTQATSHGILRIEKLQQGCQKLKVLRITNSQITLSTANMQETMDSPGFPDLEELSVAALTDESRILGDEHLQRILKTSSKLKLLDVRGCARLTHESLIRLPAWDIKHLFLSRCLVLRDVGSGLELIAAKWAHSLIELDLAWANVQQPLDNALRSLAEKGSESPLAHLNLCGSSVSEEAVKDILANCALSSINLASCRGLPRGVKRLMQGPHELQELREALKVQMKVKVPAELKKERERELATVAAAAATPQSIHSAAPLADSGGGGSGDT